MDVTIRQASVADKTALFKFLAQAYGDRSQYKFPQRWEWAYEHNPHWHGPNLPIWIAVTPAGQVVGQSAALVEPLWVNGREFRVSWGIDFHVLPDFRGQGLGSKLQAANDAATEIFMSLSMADSAARIKSRLGLQALPPVPAYQKILNHDPASVSQTLSRRLPWLPQMLTDALSRPIAARLTARDRKQDSAIPSHTDYQIQALTSFDEIFDVLWTRISGHYTALVRRDAAYLAWKYGRQPHIDPEILLALNGADEPSGYLVVRQTRPPERSAGIILDLFSAPGDSGCIQSLLAHAIRHFRARGVTTLRAASSQPELQKALQAAGFKPHGQTVPMVRTDIELPSAGWLLSKGDHDWDQYPLA